MAISGFSYAIEPVYTGGDLADLRIAWPDGKSWLLLGTAGERRELDALRPLPENITGLPVLLGAGLGHALTELLRRTKGPVIVIDKEAPIHQASSLGPHSTDLPERVVWLHPENPEDAAAAVAKLQMQHGGLGLCLAVNPVYLRLDRDYYDRVRTRLQAGQSVNFWAKAKYSKFTSWPPRILLITSQYFLMGEVIAACKRLGAPHRFLQIDNDETGRAEFIEQLLTAVIEFKPDFVFTINHLGVDREGVLADLLHKLELPLASWFVDNPHLILYLYDKLNSPYTAIYTWDADNIPSLRAQGFETVEYLPLATDPQRFIPRTPQPNNPLRCRVGFVGNSMHYKVGHRLRVSRPPRPLLLRYREIASRFKESSEPSVRAFLQAEFPDLFPYFESFDNIQRKLAFEAMITWEATRQYRASCIEQTMDFNPLLVGDKGWNITFKNNATWRWHPEISYYEDLPLFYPLCEVNFNCTSKQMKGAVNQRVFDVPAAGAFVLTDWRDQIDRLLEPDKEVVCYHSVEEIPDLLRYYLNTPSARDKVVQAARARVLAEHSYEIRLEQLMRSMQKLFGYSI